jgi:SAM-dependent methyltransferase
MQSEAVSLEQESYEIEDLWKPEYISAADKERVSRLSECIPEDVRTLLDVGCGGGVFVNHLSQGPRTFDRLCGVDRSEAALQYVQCEKQRANIDTLPFKDGEFDMATCLEVVEHLPLAVYERSLMELTRVARKYLMISVPNEQDLDAALVQCPSCHTRFNPDYHMRSFDEAQLKRLFESQGFSCWQAFPIARVESMRYINTLRQWWLWKGIEAPPWYAVCPMCGWRDSTGRASSPERSAGGSWKTWVKRLWPKRISHIWIAAVYERA